MLERRYPFEDCLFRIQVQGTDRTGGLWGIVDITDLDGVAHLVAPRRVALFDPKDWRILAQEVASRNSGNADLWQERGAQVRVALIEDIDVAELLNPTSTTAQLHSTIRGDAVVQFAPISLASRQRPAPREFIVEDLVPAKVPVSLWGDSGQGKSLIAMTMGQCVALGDSFLGLRTLQTPVLYLDWELDEDEQTRRAYDVAEGLGHDGPPANFHYQRMDYSFIDCLPQFAPAIDEGGYGLVIVDSLGLACGGDPEVARFIIPFFLALRRLPCTCLLVDHQSRLQTGQKYRDKDAFGSIYKKHLSRSGMQVQVIVDQGNKKGIVIRHAKANFSALRSDTYAWLEFDAGATRLYSASASEMEDAGATDEMGTAAQIRVALRELGPSTAKAISESAGINDGTARNELARMKQSKQVVEVGKEGHAVIYDLAERG